MAEDIKQTVDRAEKIGVIGSPSSTSGLTVDILGTAVNKRLVGNLSVFNYSQDGNDHYALGQITEITMQNVWTQDPTMRGLIRLKGRVDPITERQDTHTAKMIISSVFSKKTTGFEQSILGTVPSTGTPLKLVNEDVMSSLLSDYQQQLFYLGKAYSNAVKMPVWLKHFGNGPAGAGEAYHIGIFGKTGSGKSVLAKMMMVGYAKHREMSIFILDPQGEFARDFKQVDALKNTFRSLSKNVEIYDLHKLVLTGPDLLKRILANSGFLEKLGIIHETNKMQAANQIERILTQVPTPLPLGEKQRYAPYEAHERSAFDRVLRGLQNDEILQHIYTSRDLRQRVISSIESANIDELYTFWKKITNLFKYESRGQVIKIKDLVKKIQEQNSIVIIDLSEANIPEDVLWTDPIKLMVIRDFLGNITNCLSR